MLSGDAFYERRVSRLRGYGARAGNPHSEAFTVMIGMGTPGESYFSLSLDTNSTIRMPPKFLFEPLCYLVILKKLHICELSTEHR